MFKIRKMTVWDIAAAIELTDTVKWELTDGDFRFMLKLEPNGCFVIYDVDDLIGMLTTIRFDDQGWIGNVIVNPQYRNRGVGSFLMRHAIEFLRDCNVQTIGLYAYLDVIPFYEQLGFKRDEMFVFLTGSGSQCADIPNVSPIADPDFEKVLAFDRCCLGVSREKLLKPLFLGSRELCFVTYEGDKLGGFIMGGRYLKTAEIGPLISCSENRATDLLRVLLGKFIGLDVNIGIPQSRSKMLSLLRQLGFRESFKFLRMHYGCEPQNKGCIFAIESLERG